MSETANKKAKSSGEEAERSTGQRESTRLDTRNTTNGGAKVARTTAVVPEPLNQNWEAYAVTRGIPKNDVLVTALSTFLESEGMNPHKKPKLQISY
jgi:hypothetical protein